MKNQKGFTVVAILLAVIALILFGGAGYYVYDSNKADTKPAASSSDQASSNSSPSEPQKDPTINWNIYKDRNGLYEFKHPAAWTFAKNLDLCNPGLVLFGANTESTGACASDGAGQMSIEARKGDLLRSDYELLENQYKDIKSESVNVSGVAGLKQLGTFNPAEEVFVGPASGDKKLIYIFQDKGYTYAVSYYFPKDGRYPDVQSDFEILVNKTLKFKQ